jgi:hypothetical protein
MRKGVPDKDVLRADFQGLLFLEEWIQYENKQPQPQEWGPSMYVTFFEVL